MEGSRRALANAERGPPPAARPCGGDVTGTCVSLPWGLVLHPSQIGHREARTGPRGEVQEGKLGGKLRFGAGPAPRSAETRSSLPGERAFSAPLLSAGLGITSHASHGRCVLRASRYRLS